MPIRPEPQTFYCPKCGWQKTTAPRSDVLMPGDIYAQCPKCGNPNLDMNTQSLFQPIQSPLTSQENLYRSNEPPIKRDSTLRNERLQQLMESSQREVLQQIIGPFGLTPAMFDDKDGGNVTTQHNAEQNIFAKESEELNRTDYDYAAAKHKKIRDSVRTGNMNSQEFEDQYTGKLEPTRRTDSNGKQVMNAELDHTIPVKDIHRQGGWIKSKEGRAELSSTEENLNYTTHKTNRSKSAKSPEEALSKENGFDPARIEPIVKKAQEAIEKNLPNTSERLKYHGKELVNEGAKEAGRNAMRQALGVLLHEFVSGSFGEIKTLLIERHNEENLIDRLIKSLKKVMNRVIKKLKTALDAVIQGGRAGIYQQSADIPDQQLDHDIQKNCRHHSRGYA